MNARVLMREVANKNDSSQKGDYWFCSDGSVVLRCPYCDLMESAHNHTVIQKNPLSLSPSLVGPGKVELKCGHHFFIRNGWAE